MLAPRDWALAMAGTMTVAAFIGSVLDKRRAARGRRRIPERHLLLLALLGGSPGLLAGMIMLRHKVRKLSFLARFLVVALVQLVVAWVWIRPAVP